MLLSEALNILQSNSYLIEAKSNNKGLNAAAKNKDDEYYTHMKDVVKEMKNYDFSGKVVYCCCDNPEWSNVYKYFEENYDSLGLAGLISSHYEEKGSTYWTEYIDGERIEHPLEGNGDCTSAECKALANKADIIVTNPPFSIFNDIVKTYLTMPFIMLCIPMKMGNRLCLPLFKAGKLRYGYTTIGSFYRPNGEKDKHVYTAWYTNLPVKKNFKPFNFVEYDEEKFPTYDNFDGVDCSDQHFIPDTDKIIGLPLSVLRNIDPDNNPFEILGVENKLVLNGKKLFDRIMVKLK